MKNIRIFICFFFFFFFFLYNVVFIIIIIIIIIIISAKKHRLWYAFKPPSTHNQCLEQKYEEYQNFLSDNFHFF